MVAARSVHPPFKRLLTLGEAAAYCGVGEATFKSHLRIRPVRIGRLNRYDVRDIDKWISAQSNQQPQTDEDWLDGLD